VAGSLVGDSGQLPAAGGNILGFAGAVNLSGTDYSLTAPTVPGAAAMARVVGCSPAVNSTGTLLNFRLTVGNDVITGDTAQAQVSAQCPAGAVGSALITGLQINGTSLPPSFNGSVAGQTMSLPNSAGTLTVDEQIATGATLTVDAVHVHTAGGQDIILGTAAAGRTDCAPPAATATPTAAIATPTIVPTGTATPVATATLTATAVPATATGTAAPATATATAVLSTATATAVPPTATSTAAPVVATSTSTSAPQATATSTAAPPTATATTAPPAPTATPAQGVTVTVSIEDGGSTSDFQFSPAVINVAVGTTVVWTNHSSLGIAHTTTSDGGKWDSGNLAPGQSFSFTFTSAGSFPYHCTIHPFMHGTVNVS
jgi:plastocyanin